MRAVSPFFAHCFVDLEQAMNVTDIRGHQLTGAGAASLPHYETAVRQLNLYSGDPVASVDTAIAANPDFVMAHALKAWLHLLGTETAGLTVAQEALEAAEHLPT